MIEEKVDIKGLAKKVKDMKGLTTAALISAIAALSPTQLQMLQTILNTAMRTVAEEKLREEIRKQIKEVVKNPKVL